MVNVHDSLMTSKFFTGSTIQEKESDFFKVKLKNT